MEVGRDPPDLDSRLGREVDGDVASAELGSTAKVVAEPSGEVTGLELPKVDSRLLEGPRGCVGTREAVGTGCKVVWMPAELSGTSELFDPGRGTYFVARELPAVADIPVTEESVGRTTRLTGLLGLGVGGTSTTLPSAGEDNVTEAAVSGWEAVFGKSEAFCVSCDTTEVASRGEELIVPLAAFIVSTIDDAIF